MIGITAAARAVALFHANARTGHQARLLDELKEGGTLVQDAFHPQCLQRLAACERDALGLAEGRRLAAGDRVPVRVAHGMSEEGIDAQ